MPDDPDKTPKRSFINSVLFTPGLKGFLAGYCTAAFLSHRLLWCAAIGLVVGISAEQANPRNFPNLQEKSNEVYELVKQKYWENINK